MAVMGISLAGCSWLGSTSHDPNPRVYGIHDRVPEGGGRYKVGDPYTVDGQRFYPHEDNSYDKTGTASWYGEYFHGRKTANGEWYDMNRMSAAHPTLPLPVYARVTNMQNGQSVVVRVNDRGPFRRNRIIDLSKAAATKLGMVKQGTAPVRVSYLARAPLEGDVSNMQAIDRGSSWLAPSWTSSIENSSPVHTGSTGRAKVGTRPGRWQNPPAATRNNAVRVNRPETARNPMQPIIPQGYYVQAATFTDQASAQNRVSELTHLGGIPGAAGANSRHYILSGPSWTFPDRR